MTHVRVRWAMMYGIFGHKPCYCRVSVELRPWQTRTHCCGHIVTDTNVSPFARAGNICCGPHKFCIQDTKNVSDFVQKHFVSATNVARAGKQGNICVGNNVSATMCPRLPGPLERINHIACRRGFKTDFEISRNSSQIFDATKERVWVP